MQTAFWRILQSTEAVFQEFRARFLGKQSPVHFFWGQLRSRLHAFLGGRNRLRSEKAIITSEAYSHECSSLGWWPGGRRRGGPGFLLLHGP